MSAPIWHTVGDTNDFLYPDFVLASGMMSYQPLIELFGNVTIAKDGYRAYIAGTVTKDAGGGTPVLPAHDDLLLMLPVAYRPAVVGRLALGMPTMVGAVGTTPPDQSEGNIAVFGDGPVRFWRTSATTVGQHYVMLSHSWLTNVNGE